MSPRTWPASLLAASLLVAAAAPGLAQSSEVVLEAGASRVRPPTEADGSAASYIVAGIRASRFHRGGSGIYGGFLAGRALGGSGGDFATVDAGASAWTRPSGPWALGVDVRAFAFEVAAPYPYRAGGVEGSAGVRLEGVNMAGELLGTAGWGRSRAELRRYVDGPARTFTDELWRWGGSAEVLAGAGAFAAGVAGGLHETAGGTYRSIGGRLVLSPGGSAVELRVDWWDTPAGSETTGGVALLVPLGGAWVARAFAGRVEPDPLTLADPGEGGGGVLLGRRLAGGGDDGARFPGSTVHEIRDADAEGARVRFRVERPEAREAALLGDFTLWEPVAMTREGDLWVVTVRVPVGVYHFGFLVDGVWHVPEDAPDVVPDEWGRKNATLVVEPNATAGPTPDAQGAGR